MTAVPAKPGCVFIDRPGKSTKHFVRNLWIIVQHTHSQISPDRMPVMLSKSHVSKLRRWLWMLKSQKGRRAESHYLQVLLSCTYNYRGTTWQTHDLVFKRFKRKGSDGDNAEISLRWSLWLEYLFQRNFNIRKKSLNTEFFDLPHNFSHLVQDFRIIWTLS